jgi:hypothetical protein
MFLAVPAHPASQVAVGAAVTAFAVGVAAGWCVRGWWIAESDEQSVRQRYKNTRRVMWGSRQAVIGTVLLLWAVALAWMYGQGR